MSDNHLASTSLRSLSFCFGWISIFPFSSSAAFLPSDIQRFFLFPVSFLFFRWVISLYFFLLSLINLTYNFVLGNLAIFHSHKSWPCSRPPLVITLVPPSLPPPLPLLSPFPTLPPRRATCAARRPGSRGRGISGGRDLD